MRWTIAVVMWVLCIAGAVAALQRYASTPGEAGATPAVLPASDRAGAPGTPVVYLFLHERCPCSRATLEELSRHSAVLQDTDTRIVLSGPGSTAEDTWTVRDLIASAAPNASIVEDVSGEIAKRYGAMTSGHAVIYRASGDLRFSGGLTPSRGHLGPCAGREALRSLMNPNPGPTHAAPVFGCPIVNAVSYCGDACPAEPAA